MIPIDLTGKKFGRLTVLAYAKMSKGTGHAKWVVQCSCKLRTMKKVRGSHLTSGNVRSCGCLSREISSRLLKKYATSKAHKGAGNPQWKGDQVKHAALHTWLNRYFKKHLCEKCGSKKNLDWALKKGKRYSHKRENFIVLCRSHHLQYDYTKERKMKISKTLTGTKRHNVVFP